MQIPLEKDILHFSQNTFNFLGLSTFYDIQKQKSMYIVFHFSGLNIVIQRDMWKFFKNKTKKRPQNSGLQCNDQGCTSRNFEIGGPWLYVQLPSQ